MAREIDGVAAQGDAPWGGAGTESGAPARVTPGQRWLARLAFAAAFAAVVVVLLSGALRSVTALLAGFAGLAIMCAAAWWFLANRGIVRWLACAVLVAAPVGVAALARRAVAAGANLLVRGIYSKVHYSLS